MAKMVKNLPATQKTRVQVMGWEGLLEKEIATHSSILAWEIPWTEEPCGLESLDSQRVGHNWATYTSLDFTNPLPKLCLPWVKSTHEANIKMTALPFSAIQDT